MAGQIGIDEGGILAAISKPVGTQVHESFEYNRKGLLTDKTTTTLSVSLADVTVVLMLLGIVKFATLDPADQATVLAGPITGPILRKVQESGGFGSIFTLFKSLRPKFF